MTPTETRVLVVDDEPILRDLIANEFKIAGFEVEVAESGNRALRLLKDKPISIIISDIRMPDGSGLDLLAATSSDHPEIPVILMTGYSGVTVPEALNLGAAGVFMKPFDRDLVFAKVNSCLTPITERWQVKQTALESRRLDLNVGSIDEAASKSELRLGRGGFAAIWQEKTLPPEGAVIDFVLQSSAGQVGKLEGQGVVRWAKRSNKEAQISRVGIEFVFLGEGREAWISLLQSLDTRSFVPAL